jgi:hypothetical protein
MPDAEVDDRGAPVVDAPLHRNLGDLIRMTC